MSDPFFGNVRLLAQPVSGEAGGTTTNLVDAAVITANGGASVATGNTKFNSASLDNDATGYFSTAGLTDFGTSDFTVEAWVYLDATTDFAVVGGSDNQTFDFAYTGGSLRIGRINTAWDLTLSWTPSTGQWYHLVAQRNGTTARIFVDGVSLGSGTVSYNYTTSGTLYIASSTTTDRRLNGQIAELRITQGVARYNTAGFTPPTAPFSTTWVDPYWDDVTLSLPMDGADGSTTFTDVSSSPLSPSTVAGNAQIDTGQSKFGGSSMLLDGSGDYLVYENTGEELIDLTQPYTIEGWLRITNDATNNTIYGSRPASGSGGLLFYVTDVTRKLHAFIQNAGGAISGLDEATNAAVVSLNTWHHFALTYDGTTFSTWLDGSLGDSSTLSGTPTQGAKGRIGYDLPASVNAFTGNLDDIRITKGVARYTAAFTPPTAPFPTAGITRWTPAETTTELWLDASDATTITEVSGEISQWDDKSGNAYHLAQSTASQKPNTVSADLNGLDGVYFDGGDLMFVDASANLQANLAKCFLFVWKGDTGAGTYDMAFATRENVGGVDNTASGWLYVGDTRDIYGHTGNGDSIQAGAYTSGNTYLSVVNVDTNGASVDHYQYGTLGLAGSVSTQSGEVAGNHFVLGSQSGAYMGGTVYEFIAIPEFMADADRQKIEGYLAWKWGLEANLASGHPYEFSPPPTEVVGGSGPTIDTQPVDTTVDENTVATFTVAATASAGALTYQWKNGDTTDVVGETAATFDFTAVEGDTGNTYYCAVTDDNGTVNTDTVTLTVTALTPTIDTQPVDVTVDENANAAFSIAATASSGALSYQWYKNAAPVGTDSASYNFTALAADHLASIYCDVTDSNGTITSSTVTLTLTLQATDPVDVSVSVGNDATFNVTASFGTLPYTYQWKKGGVDIVGETAATLVYTPVIADSGSVFTVVVDDGGTGPITPAGATLTVRPAYAAEAADIDFSQMQLVKNPDRKELYLAFTDGGEVGSALPECQPYSCAAFSDGLEDDPTYSHTDITAAISGSSVIPPSSSLGGWSSPIFTAGSPWNSNFDRLTYLAPGQDPALNPTWCAGDGYTVPLALFVDQGALGSENYIEHPGILGSRGFVLRGTGWNCQIQLPTVGAGDLVIVFDLIDSGGTVQCGISWNGASSATGNRLEGDSETWRYVTFGYSLTWAEIGTSGIYQGTFNATLAITGYETVTIVDDQSIAQTAAGLPTGGGTTYLRPGAANRYFYLADVFESELTTGIDAGLLFDRKFQSYTPPEYCTIPTRTALVYNFEDDNYTWMDAAAVDITLQPSTCIKYGEEAGWATRWDTTTFTDLTWDDLNTAQSPWNATIPPRWSDMAATGAEEDMQMTSTDGLWSMDKVVYTGDQKEYFVERVNLNFDDIAPWTSESWKHIRQFYFHLQSPVNQDLTNPNNFAITAGWARGMMDTPDYLPWTTINLQTNANAGKHKWDLRTTGRYLALKMDFQSTQKITMTGADIDAEEAHGR